MSKPRIIVGVVAAAITILMLTAASSCSATSSGPQGGAVTNGPTDSGAGATPTPTDTPTAEPFMHLGQEIDTDSGNKFTVSGLRHVPSNNEFNTPPPGGYFAALDVKECAGQAALTTNPSEWSLGLSDDSQIQGGDSGLVTTPGADLPTLANVQPGQCVSGWVAFAMPANSTVTKVLLNQATFYWAVP
jgi:hypothetical protein